MNSFVLKIIGIISMFCDHYSDVIFGEFTNLNLIGRLAFPIFAFQISLGYIHTKNLKDYIFRLGIFACVSQLFFFMFKTVFETTVLLNVIFTFFFGIIALLAFDKIKNKFFGFLAVVLIGYIAYFLKTDYGWLGIALVFLFYIYNSCKKDINPIIKKLILLVVYTILVVLFNLNKIILYPVLFTTYLKIIVCTVLALIPIFLYNGKQGPKVKYLFYMFYPLQFFVLYLLKQVL